MAEKIKVTEFFNSSDHKLVIRDIFAIYHHSWDVIGESIQNAIDSVLKRAEEGGEGFEPTINIRYDVRLKEIVIEDNGFGIPQTEMRRIVAPHVSLKDPRETNRGEFGVGLTLVAFSSNSFKLESVCNGAKASLEIKNGYNWAMDLEGKEELDITYDSQDAQEKPPYTKIIVKPVRFSSYTVRQLEYVLRRYTAIGDFWSCHNDENGRVNIKLTYCDEDGKVEESKVENKFYYPANYLADIGVETVDYETMESELRKGREQAIPNWIGFGLTHKDRMTEGGKEFTYFALFCRTNYYKQLAERIGLGAVPDEEADEQEAVEALPGSEALNSGIFVSKKGMPLGAIVDNPRTAQVGYWRAIFVMINCDNLKTEPGRKRLHVEDEQLVKAVARKIFYKLTKYAHYIIPRDPDEELESLLRNVDKNLQTVRAYRQTHRLQYPGSRINMGLEPANEQTLIAMFHELIGAKGLLGYKALKLSATETYDGIYEYEVGFEHVGQDHWKEWLRQFPAKERKEIEERKVYHVEDMIVEFKMRLEDVIKDFLQKTKYHSHIKLIVAWEANQEAIKKKGWLLEELPKQKQKFYGAAWRLRPSAEGQTRGILATDVLLLKDFLSSQRA